MRRLNELIGAPSRIALSLCLFFVSGETSCTGNEEHTMSSGQTSAQVLKSSAEDSYVRLEAESVVMPAQLKIHYTLVGKSAVPILVFDALRSVGQDGALKYDGLLAYVAFRDPSTLIVVRMIPPLPKRKDVEFAFVPWAHRIVGNDVLQGNILVPIPAEESNPYYPARDASVFRKATAKQLRLSLQYAPLDANLQVTPVPDTQNLFQVKGAGADLHEISVTVQLADKLPVRLRSDRFESLYSDESR